MLSEKETQEVLEKFFNDCMGFWKRQGHEIKEAFAFAIEDVERLTTDPFVPCGKKLDEKAKADFIRYRKMDLGR